jgi:hypothetical protein
MVLKFLMGVDTYTGNLRYAIDMCMGMPEPGAPALGTPGSPNPVSDTSWASSQQSN